MLFCKKNPGPTIEIHKEAPRIGTPYTGKKNNGWGSKFYESNPELNALIGGYAKGPEDSYARELMEKYPLRNE